ncbi:diguanylate cyclase (GGDEF) domain-containing protein [Abditibacterium utsteinense]|uniref:Diguanylate cyclase (GGDEF) domain-containing protein n=1 Tax=Abditibacterium utsteinense TaxID=1960156 RepID=A0A2S8SPF3_9BACT|nr:diguanylate cyclase [Abditibacterium utsteinense]PQV62677.1 diguanylate cyclase (GGDEF) domain-containing protein [Abditibacterium utsteinense]
MPKRFTIEKALAKRRETPFSLALIDHLKRINDEFGHDIDDEVLRSF